MSCRQSIASSVPARCVPVGIGPECLQTKWIMTMMISLMLAAAVLAGPPETPRTADRLKTGDEPVRVVCFGDSITGVYYHTGGKRAWPELLEIALRNAFPDATVTVYNAGVSGNTTDAALKRINKDVLARKPHAVVVMFGMNDLAYGPVSPDQDDARKTRFEHNLASIVSQCRNIGAEVILMTPNPVYPEAVPRRPPTRVGEFAECVRRAGEQLDVPVVDAFARWHHIREQQPRRWRVMMSETIHPSLAGHRLFAEMSASAMTGKQISLAALQPHRDALARTKTVLAGNPASLTLVVAGPAAAAVKRACLDIAPETDISIVPWPTNEQSLTETLTWSKRIRGLPDKILVVGGFSPQSLEAGNDQEGFVRQASWVVNYALPFGRRTWDVLFLSPACFGHALTDEQSKGAELVKEVVEGHDLMWLGPGGTVDITNADALRLWLETNLR